MGKNMRRVCALFLSACMMMGCSSTQGWQKEILQETVEIEGLNGEYDFLFLTDTHMVVPDEEDGDKIEDYSDLRFDEFQNEEDISSAEQFDEWIAYANAEKIDALLLGGDIIDYPSVANIEHLEANLEPYMQKDSSIHSIEFEEFIIVAVDNSANQIEPDAMEAYRQILQQKKPVIVMLHVPLLTQSVLSKAKKVWNSGVVLGGGNYGGIYPDETSQEFITLTTAKDSPVVLVLAGHVHFSDRDMINENITQLVGDAGYKGCAMHIHLTGK